RQLRYVRYGSTPERRERTIADAADFSRVLTEDFGLRVSDEVAALVWSAIPSPDRQGRPRACGPGTAVGAAAGGPVLRGRRRRPPRRQAHRPQGDAESSDRASTPSAQR